MIKKIYAVMDCEVSPVKYLRASKEYELTAAFGDDGFAIISETGMAGFYLWSGCAHLNGGNWRRIERDEAPAQVQA